MKKGCLLLAALLFIGISTPHISFATIVNPTIVPGKPDPATVKAAMHDFKALSKKDKKERFKEVKSAIRHYKAEKKAGDNNTDTNTLLLVILGILLPPLAVYLYEGEINSRFWIDLLLTLIFWLPGVIYALVLILGGY